MLVESNREENNKRIRKAERESTCLLVCMRDNENFGKESAEYKSVNLGNGELVLLFNGG